MDVLSVSELLGNWITEHQVDTATGCVAPGCVHDTFTAVLLKRLYSCFDYYGIGYSFYWEYDLFFIFFQILPQNVEGTYCIRIKYCISFFIQENYNVLKSQTGDSDFTAHKKNETVTVNIKMLLQPRIST